MKWSAMQTKGSSANTFSDRLPQISVSIIRVYLAYQLG